MLKLISFSCIVIAMSSFMLVNHSTNYSWLPKSKETISNSIKVPKGFQIQVAEKGSFQNWLQNLPIKPKGTPIRYYNQKRKWYQLLNGGVLDIDIGEKDLQQCADAIIRLRAEYLYSQRRYSEIAFNLTNGFRVGFQKWSNGYRIKVSGNNTSWYKKYNKVDVSYSNFKAYLNFVFIYAGSYSLSKELKNQSIQNVNIGDVFIKGGFPGHGIILVNMAQNKNGETLYMFAQSYMPAQNIHLIKNLRHPHLGNWFKKEQLVSDFKTLEFEFSYKDLKTW